MQEDITSDSIKRLLKIMHSSTRISDPGLSRSVRFDHVGSEPVTPVQ